MLEANDVGRRTIELDLQLIVFECQVQSGNAMNVGPMLAMVMIVLMAMVVAMVVAVVMVMVMVVVVVVVVVVIVRMFALMSSLMCGSMIMPFAMLRCQERTRHQPSRQRQYR
ncbi:hypothetical protein [Halochromatium glycolicum]